MSSPQSVASRIDELTVRLAADPGLVSGALGLPRDVDLSAYLASNPAVSPSDVLAIAEVLDVPTGVLLGRMPMETSLGVSLRLGLAEKIHAPADALAYAQVMLSHLAALNVWADEEPSAVDGLAPSQDRHFKTAGKVTAERVRDFLGLGFDPVTDLVSLVESARIPVAFQPLPEGVHGLNVKDVLPSRALRSIVVSCNDWWARQRYTLAHEFCHGIYDDEGQVIVDEVTVPETLPELRAESFARHLLLPETALRREMRANGKRDGSIEQLVGTVIIKYGVSRDVVVRALKDDGLLRSESLSEELSRSTVRALVDSAGLGGHWDELVAEQHLPSGSPWLVERAVQAFSNGWVGMKFVADLLGESEETAAARLAEQGWAV